MQKGQAIIEFIFLILIIVVYLTSTTIPLVESAQKTINDTQNITRANNELQKIINAINEINLFSDGSKQTLQIFIPSNTTLKCNSLENKISFETQLIQEPYPIECNQGKCKKEYGLNIDIQCPITQLNGPQKVNLTIQKANSQITLLRSG
ncbi:MAG: hypothetical protein ACOX1V_00360 [Candidatus Iainarchaeum sp.]|jgi:uncharacterized protein (UPF0333 family)|nr:MAG: hypothetical protein BWY55_00110 [archaeon ADurb.Bin336]